jgi:hypothetical protein
MQHLVVDSEQRLVICRRRILRLVLAAGLAPHLFHFPRVRPGPIHLFGEVARIARAEGQSRAAVIHQFAHRTELGSHNRQRASERFDKRQRKTLVTLAGQYEKAGALHRLDHLIFRHPA